MGEATDMQWLSEVQWIGDFRTRREPGPFERMILIPRDPSSCSLGGWSQIRCVLTILILLCSHRGWTNRAPGYPRNYARSTGSQGSRTARAFDHLSWRYGECTYPPVITRAGPRWEEIQVLHHPRAPVCRFLASCPRNAEVTNQPHSSQTSRRIKTGRWQSTPALLAEWGRLFPAVDRRPTPHSPALQAATCR